MEGRKELEIGIVDTHAGEIAEFPSYRVGIKAEH